MFNEGCEFKILNRKREVASVSNSITFKTLANPILKINSVEQDRISLVALLDCKLDLFDNNLNHARRVHGNICGSTMLYLKEIDAV
jgi:hypothetical protein